MKQTLFLLMLLIPINAYSSDNNWMQLLQDNKIEQAQELCKKLEYSTSVSEKASAYKCLANLAVIGKDVVLLEGNDTGGGVLKSGWRGAPLEKAVFYLNEGIKLTPEDETIHQGRMHLLLESGLYTKAQEALVNSLRVLNSRDYLELWLNYTPYYFDAGQHKAGILFTEQLIKQFGEDHRLFANLGAFHAMLSNDKEAIKYLEKAIEINPNSPLNTWNLARLLDYTGNLMEADKLYEKALSLKAGEYDTDLDPKMNCVYSEFLLAKMQNKSKACIYYKDFCAIKDMECSGDNPPSENEQTGHSSNKQQ
jgi:tetratricopeptide (TPR) repeat protein